MDENLINQTLEEYDVTEDINVIEINVPVEDVETEIPVEEETYDVSVEPEEEAIIDISESMGWVSGDDRYHDSLLGVDFPRQHPITAITNLREELDEIERLKTVYSDKKGVADYYEWEDKNPLAENRVGYFVSMCEDVRTIKKCDSNDVFGVVVDDAAFIGGQDDIVRDYKYGLVVCSGIVRVRCELDVKVGDYVISNSYGVAQKTDSGYGCKVIAIHEIDTSDNTSLVGVRHAVVSLDLSINQMDTMAKEIDNLTERVETNEINIISAINVANRAHQLALETSELTEEQISDIVDKVKDAVNKADSALNATENMEDIVSQTQTISAQAKAIAESAVTSAESMRKDAVDKANEALKDTSDLRDEFVSMEEQISDIEGQVTIVTKKINGKCETVDSIDGVEKQETVVYYAKDTKLYHYYNYDIGDWTTTSNPRDAGLTVALAGVQVETDENSANIDQLTSWQGDTNIAMARIEQKADANGAYIQSTVANIDKYSVGPHSQAYGFTLEQAASVLEEGMIYVPTEDVTEAYEYVENKITTTYKRSFTPGYLYKWAKLTDYPYGWITVDKNYNEIADVNTSAPSVYFSRQEIMINKTDNNDHYGYWYTNSTEIIDIDGNPTVVYESYTLYKWESYEYEDGDDEDEDSQTGYHWVAVATLAGNSSNRAVSQIRQDANSIESRVTNAEGSAASSKQWIDENDANIQDVVSWKSDNGESLVTFMQTAGDNFASASQVAKIVDKDGNINAASIVTAVNESGSSVVVDAQHIALDGYVTVTDLSTGGRTTINGSNITSGTIDASKITVTNLNADNITSGTIESKEYEYESGNYAINGTAIDLDTGYIRSKNFAIDENGDAHFKGEVHAGEGDIGDWNIEHNFLYSGSSGMCSAIANTEGLQFELNDNGYTVSGYEGQDVFIYIPDVYNGVSVVSIKTQAFKDNKNLARVTIPDGVTSIGDQAFYNCSSLTSVTIPNSVTSIGDDAFYYCSSLTSVTIPDSVTSIGSSAFCGCSSLTSVTIPDSVTEIGEYAFDGCSSLTIYCEVEENNLPSGWAFDGKYFNANIEYGVSLPLHYDDECKYPSLINLEQLDYIRFFAGCNIDEVASAHDTGFKPSFLVLNDGSLYASAAQIKGKIQVDEGSVGSFDITNGYLTCNVEGDNTAAISILKNDNHIWISPEYMHIYQGTGVFGDYTNSGILIYPDRIAINNATISSENDTTVVESLKAVSGSEDYIAIGPTAIQQRQAGKIYDGVTADIAYMKADTTPGTLSFKNGILVEYT